ncbi:ABC transporter ATP-binding protein [Methylovirgula sp. 4M-Z18]|uniref:ABC transporter ATP-binding protein n=1 Tax=Methylovirgula sp. 4M-Z18 TaxID=2293567 RepID=UPI000E2F53C5|nr:ABC transporter ATP-binding protein [Methylovirgula sp. 4M-Z18]RFB81346.1 ABC transporter ATP-binding protein [Methylovirgula sp. 4M-Z18]
MSTALELVNIDKSFGPVHANKQVNLKVSAGSIHGIIGENGAGKSTLMSIIYGFYEADAGDILVSDKSVRIRSSREAIALGIGMVHQHFMLVEPMTVLENVMLGAEGGAFLAGGKTALRKKLAELAKVYGLAVDPDAKIADLSVGLRQRVEIIKALVRGAQILILDEPTAVLTPAEADQLFAMLAVLRKEGKTVILITHKLREIMAITDRVSVMRRGEMIAHFETAQTNKAELASAMVGRPVLLKVEKRPAEPGVVLLEAKNLVVRDALGVPRLDDVSFTLRAGEIVGVAGVSGNGQSELLQALAGIAPLSSGAIFLTSARSKKNDPTRVVGMHEVTGFKPDDMRRLGLMHVPEDRHAMGLVLAFEEYENSILGYHDAPEYARGPFLDLARIRQDAKEKIEHYNIQPPNHRLKTANFSGGNQQKIVLAREIERDPTVLIVGQPTRGVDIGAIEFIHKRLIALRDEGKAILVVSVELDEIMSLADRVLVMCGGRITGERDANATNADDLGLLMAGVTEHAA